MYHKGLWTWSPIYTDMFIGNQPQRSLQQQNTLAAVVAMASVGWELLDVCTTPTHWPAVEAIIHHKQPLISTVRWLQVEQDPVDLNRAITILLTIIWEEQEKELCQNVRKRYQAWEWNTCKRKNPGGYIPACIGKERRLTKGKESRRDLSRQLAPQPKDGK